MIANYVEALTRAAPPRVVALSSMGANRTSGLGMITALSLLEQGLRDLISPIAFVRAGGFFENFHYGLQVAQGGTLPVYYKPTGNRHRKSTMVSTNDIGAEVATLLTRQIAFRICARYGGGGMFQDSLFRGKKILVTGGGTGLGRGMAERLLGLGAEIAICGRRKSVCDAAAEEMMKMQGGVVKSYGVDICDATAVEATVKEIFRDGPLTLLINNAAGNFIARTEDLSPRGFDAIANIVMHGTFYVTQAVGKRWIAGGLRGSVVSIVVNWVRNGGPYVVPSAMSKAAVQAMMSLAAEWGRHGIRLNAIAPGLIPTEGMSRRLMPLGQSGRGSAEVNPMKRVGCVEELQNLAAFLLCDGCEWLTGETIAMDGAEALATGGNYYELRKWGAEQWKSARAVIEAENAREKAQRA